MATIAECITEKQAKAILVMLTKNVRELVASGDINGPASDRLAAIMETLQILEVPLVHKDDSFMCAGYSFDGADLIG